MSNASSSSSNSSCYSSDSELGDVGLTGLYARLAYAMADLELTLMELDDIRDQSLSTIPDHTLKIKSSSSSSAMVVSLDEPQQDHQDSSWVAILDGDSRSIGVDIAVNNNGLQPVADLPQDEVAAESSPLLDGLAEIQQGLQQCNDLEHQYAPPQEEVAKYIVETLSLELVKNYQESSTREGETRINTVEFFKKLDDVSVKVPIQCLL
ncbi:hypothetical protein Tco_1396173 [Tanacetum coccineum]